MKASNLPRALGDFQAPAVIRVHPWFFLSLIRVIRVQKNLSHCGVVSQLEHSFDRRSQTSPHAVGQNFP